MISIPLEAIGGGQDASGDDFLTNPTQNLWLNQVETLVSFWENRETDGDRGLQTRIPQDLRRLALQSFGQSDQ